MNPFLWVSPISQNVTDAVIEYCEEKDKYIGFIPSRRQVEFDGGYTGKDTQSLSRYVSQKTNRCPILRDHGGLNQGSSIDLGFKSFIEDLKWFDGIHVDPFLNNDFTKAVFFTLDIVDTLTTLNQNIFIEVGTEEAIHKYDFKGLNYLLNILQTKLSKRQFAQIKYAVIQTGTKLKNGVNTGIYNPSDLKDMVYVCKRFGKLSKIHNGDYLTAENIQEQKSLGIDAINIAPEFGGIESFVLASEFKPDEREEFFQIIYESGKWKKWFTPDFNPLSNKIGVIKACGHYVLNSPKFLALKSKMSENIDEVVKTAVKVRLDEIVNV